MFKITATTSLHYQLSALRHFNMPITHIGNGVHRATISFDTEEEAKEYLIGIAKRYYDEYEGQSDPYIDNIVTYGFLGIDGVVVLVANIQ